MNNDACKRRETILDEHITRVISNRNVFRITMNEITTSIGKLNNMNDPDQVHSSHFKYASHDFVYLTFLFFNSCLLHTHIPNDILVGAIKPEIKDKFGNAASSDNYRPVMSSTTMLKIFEYSLLPTLERYC